MTQYRLVGKKEVYIGSERIPSECISDEIGTITVTPSTTEISSQAGTFNVPNGAYDELSATITVIIPSVRFLGRIFPNLWKAGMITMMITRRVRFPSARTSAVPPILSLW